VPTRFGPFTLDPSTRQLLEDGRAIHLSPKAFDVLRVLLEARPAVVPKADLHDRIWPGTYVVDANLSVLIGEIRKALTDSAQTPRYVRTVHKVGYAFCGDAVEAPALAEATAGKSPALRSGGTGSRYWLTWNERTFALSPGENAIGRNPECAIWVDAAGVSRLHANLRLDAASGAASIEDLGSTNGTFVNEARVESAVALRDGDIVHLGTVPLTFRAWLPERSRSTERIRRASSTSRRSHSAE
jgi:DNA-binding winged helix-turn-helix (wHTH) protein